MSNQGISNGTQKMITRMILLAIMDIMSVCISSFFAIYIRYDFSIVKIDPPFWENAYKMVGFNVISMLLFFIIWNLYRSVWRYASATELFNIIGACICCGGAQAIYFKLFGASMPRSYYFFYMFSLMVLTTMIRFSYRILRTINTKRRLMANDQERINCMIIGGGASGNAILKEIETTRYLSMKVCCVIDDNPGCHGKRLRGVKIIGGRNRIKDAVMEYGIDEIIIAIPSAPPSKLKPIIEICKDTGCRIQILPAIYQLINGEVSVSKLREVEIEDLLGRDPIHVNLDEIIGYVSDRVVMVTGGGGSIGSELCRQIASHKPKQLLIVDIYENTAYDIQQELVAKYPELDLVVLIASVRNTKRMDAIFRQYKPEIIYHAAAHKHVPLMEASPNEAVKNNVFGTYKIAVAADKYHVKKFVMISTDKAVNPTNIMGASKRICEMVVQMMNRKSETEFVAVRFGNILGSNGSVVPLFKKQIAHGGPVTVTHPDIIRYFMTIPEAVSLVLQAGAFAKGGEIFVLDMGEPVKIKELAENLIRLSGYRVDEDIKIEYTGLRPGEKMYEELLMKEEGLKQTSNHLIYVGKPIEFDAEHFEEQLARLKEKAENEEDIREMIKEIVPTYHQE